MHPKARVITTSWSQVCLCTRNQESSLPAAHRCVRAPETKSHHYRLLTGVSVHPKPRVITTSCSQVCPCTLNQESSLPTAHRCVRAPETKGHHYRLLTGVSVLLTAHNSSHPPIITNCMLPIGEDEG